MKGYGILYIKNKVKRFQIGGITLDDVIVASKAAKQAEREKERIRATQRKLTEYGFLAGDAATGEINEATLKAISQVQDIQGRIGTVQDGVIGAKTLKAAKENDIDLKFIGEALNPKATE